MAVGGHSKGPVQGGLAGPDRPGPGGVVQGPSPPTVHVAPGTQSPPTPGPVGLPGPAPLGLGTSPSTWLGTGITLYYPPGIPTPVPIPTPVHLPAPHQPAVHIQR